jgi:uncharacterized protein DUF4232
MWTVLLVAAGGLLTSCGMGHTGTGVEDSKPTTVTQVVTSYAPEPAGERSREHAPEPCDAEHVQTTIAPGEHPRHGLFHTEIVATNAGGPDSCWLDGASELEFFTGDPGRALGIKEVTRDDGAGERLVLDVGDQARMSVTYPTAKPGARPECLEGTTFAEVTMPGDSQAMEAWPSIPQVVLPPVCGSVRVSFWLPGGAAGVAPN